ncbi:MAG: SDR family oxidoreductase [Saprospiraceae bacterium]|nr:SDR family oxidoreductase [Saprospiraceae bacterium]
MNKLIGKVAVVTGGNSGIGYATAKDFIANGATVIITGRTATKVSAAASELGAIGLVADQGNVKDIDNLVAQVKDQFGKVDVLFVNAGIFNPAPVEAISEPHFDNQMNINFKGAVFTLQKFLPLLNEGASVINLSSVNAYTGMPNTAIYAASKAALNSFTRTAATELAPRKIRVNAVNPGPVATEIFSKSGLPEEAINGFATAIQQRVPLKQLGTPETIAKLVTFLASDEAWFITGSEYNIDGGINVNPLLAN